MLIILDLDGTLIETSEMHNMAYDHVFNIMNIEFDIRSVPAGVSITDKIKMIKTLGYDFDDDEFKRIRDEYVTKNLHKYVKFNKELCEVLKELSTTHIVAISTNANYSFTEQVINILEISAYISKVNTIDSFPPKPDSYTFHNIIQTFNVPRSNTVIIEDSQMGIKCARDSGATVKPTKGPEDTVTILKRLL